MTLKERILEYINNFPGATDTEMEKHFRKSHQTINQTCRAMEAQGVLVRQNNPAQNDQIGNSTAGKAPDHGINCAKDQHDNDAAEFLQEEDIKHILTDLLVKEGWTVKTAWGHTPGVDIDARRGKERWLIEIKGPGSRQPMRVNYFIGILGEMLQRMDDPDARYSIAFPDMKQYRGLWSRLPQLAKLRTSIDMLLIDKKGNIKVLK